MALKISRICYVELYEIIIFKDQKSIISYSSTLRKSRLKRLDDNSLSLLKWKYCLAPWAYQRALSTLPGTYLVLNKFVLIIEPGKKKINKLQTHRKELKNK